MTFLFTPLMTISKAVAADLRWGDGRHDYGRLPATHARYGVSARFDARFL